VLSQSQHEMRVPLGDSIHGVRRRSRASARHYQSTKDKREKYPAHIGYNGKLSGRSHEVCGRQCKALNNDFHVGH
jgi:hypothetical protein